MNISNIRICKVDSNDLKAIVQFTIDDSLRATGIKLFVEADGSYSIKYPVNQANSKKLAYLFPLSNEVRLSIENQIIDAYEALP